MQILKVLSLTAATCGVFNVTSAAADGFYLDGGYAHISSSFDQDALGTDELGEFEIDPKFDLFGGHYGYAFNPYVSVEAEALFTISGETYVTPVPGFVDDITTELDLNQVYGGYVRGSFPFGNRLSAFGRVGYAYGELKARVSFAGDIYTVRETGSGLAFGGGGTFNLTDTLYVRGDYTRYDIEASKSDMFMLGIGLDF